MGMGVYVTSYWSGYRLVVCGGSQYGGAYWPRWDRSNEASQAVVSHAQWQRLLDIYLSDSPEVRLFAYGNVSDHDRSGLDCYLADLATIDPRDYRRSEQIAYWINLYNALTVQLILENYPVKSIRKLGKGFFSFGPWDDGIVTVAGQSLTLNDIEHRILRPIWKDKRIHYAVNCASIGCPDLAATAYTGAHIRQQLDDAARRFINQAKGVRLANDSLYLSSLYEWYAVDFGNRQALMTHLQAFTDQTLHRHLVGFKKRIRYGYDWRLNESNKKSVSMNSSCAAIYASS